MYIILWSEAGGEHIAITEPLFFFSFFNRVIILTGENSGIWRKSEQICRQNRAEVKVIDLDFDVVSFFHVNTIEKQFSIYGVRTN